MNMERVNMLKAMAAEAKKQKTGETPIEESGSKGSIPSKAKGKMTTSDSVTTNGSGSSQAPSLVSIPRPIFQLKLYPDVEDIKTKVVDLEVEILQVCGYVKLIDYDESSGVMNVVTFEEQSFVQPAQSSQ